MKNKKAFSLIELSIVILIIGILIVGLTQSSRLIEQFKLSSARSITQSSDVNGMKGLVLWLETSTEDSLSDRLENNDVVGVDYLWTDINPQNTIKTTAASVNGPNFTTKCINNIYCLKFDGIAQYLRTTNDNGFADGVSVFVVFKPSVLPDTGETQTLFSVNATHSAANKTFQLNIKENSDVEYSFFDDGDNAVEIQPTDGVTKMNNSSVYIADFTDNGTRQEVSLSASRTINRNSVTNNTTLKNMTVGFNIGFEGVNQNFNGDIVEVIVFNRGLKTPERDAVESYLAKKWGVVIN